MNTMAKALNGDEFLFEKNRYYYYKLVFRYSLVIGLLITVPFIIVEFINTGKPVFLYFGDYNVQQLAFYEHAVDVVRSGGWGWDWMTDLGSNFMGSYSYYMLGSPFFWLMCLFPSSWTPYLMGPMFVVKYVAAALIAYMYLKRFVKNQNYAVLGAILYAFCGFQIYNTFFNQYHEVVALFPLLLIGMEELIQNNRRGVFAFAVALNAMCNYFMFVGQVIFCVLYFICRLSEKSFRITLKNFGLLVFEAVLGVILGAVVFLPGVVALLGNTRLGGAYTGWRQLFYIKLREGEYTSTHPITWRSIFTLSENRLYWQRYGHLFSSFFFPPDIPSRVNFFEGHSERWASISGYIPLFGLSGFIAFFKTKKHKWLRYLSILLIVCLFVPILNSAFYAFNSQYYARTMYMLVLMLVLATVMALESADQKKVYKAWKVSILVCAGICAAVVIPLGLLWYKKGSGYTYGRPPFLGRFWLYSAIAFLGLYMAWWLIRYCRLKVNFNRVALLSVSCIIIVYSCLHITNGKQHSHSSDFLVNQALNGEVVLPEGDFYRIDFYRNEDKNTTPFDNLGMFWGYESIECFHSVVPASIMTFYELIGVTRNVASRPESSKYGLRSLTSSKYSFVEEGKKAKFDAKGFNYIDTQNGYAIYENENHLSMGFAYTEFVTLSDFKLFANKSTTNRHIYLCKYLVVPDDMADYFSTFMTRVTNETRELANYDTFVQSVEDRRTMSADSFEYSSDGFKSVISLDAKSPVFFSVPYEAGWSATVNGEKAEVIKVFDGFMAVVCEPGENITIEFDYNTPYQTTGIVLTFVGIAVLIFYVWFSKKKRKEFPTYKFLSDEYYDSGVYEEDRESLSTSVPADNSEGEASTGDEPTEELSDGIN